MWSCLIRRNIKSACHTSYFLQVSPDNDMAEVAACSGHVCSSFVSEQLAYLLLDSIVDMLISHVV